MVNNKFQIDNRNRFGLNSLNFRRILWIVRFQILEWRCFEILCVCACILSISYVFRTHAITGGSLTSQCGFALQEHFIILFVPRFGSILIFTIFAGVIQAFGIQDQGCSIYLVVAVL